MKATNPSASAVGSTLGAYSGARGQLPRSSSGHAQPARAAIVERLESHAVNHGSTTTTSVHA